MGGKHFHLVKGDVMNGHTFVRYCGRDNQGKTKGTFKCAECGGEFNCRISNIKNGSTRSCGCLRNNYRGNYLNRFNGVLS